MTASWQRSLLVALALAPRTAWSVLAAHRRLRRAGRPELAPGDIVFRLGHAGRALGPFLGNLGIALSSFGPYAHIALVVSVDEAQPGRSGVIEATRHHGVRVVSLAEFLGQSVYAGVFRPLVDETVRRAAVAYALDQQGLPYDEEFSLDDPHQAPRQAPPAGHYCSGLIWSAYRAAGLDITDGYRTIYRRFPLRVARRLYNLVPEAELVLPNDIFYALLRRQIASDRQTDRAGAHTLGAGDQG